MKLVEIKKYNQIVIYGAGLIAQAVINTLKESELDIEKRIVCCAVTKKNSNVNEIEGMPVYEIKEAINLFRDAYYLVAVKEIYKTDIKNTLDSYGITSYDECSMKDCISILEKKLERIAKDKKILFEKNTCKELLSEEEYFIFLNKQVRINRVLLGIDVTAHCNLNCQCCNHFSPLAKEKYLDITMYEKDLKQMSLLASHHIKELSLVGGEPLLHPQISDIIKISRKYFSNIEIFIISNGILIPKMNDEFWKTCRDNNVGILITKYPINFDYTEGEKLAIKHAVKLTYTYDSENCKTTYRLPMIENGGLNPYQNYMKCYHANQCVMLKEGKIFMCPQSACISHFNEYFDKNIPEDNFIDIYKVDSFEDIDKFLKEPIQMCEYCDICNYEYDIPWKTSKRDVREWMDI